jgi:hypothetical protein
MRLLLLAVGGSPELPEDVSEREPIATRKMALATTLTCGGRHPE